MHWTRLAPLLSATSRFDCIWIIDALPFQLAFRGSPGVPLIVQPAASGVLCVSMRSTTFQLFSLEIGAVSSIRTVSPSRYAFRSEEHTSELQSLMRNSYAVFSLKKKI